MSPEPQAAVPAIVAVFEDYPVVAVGESHGLQEAGNLYQSVVRTPRFAEAADVVVVEFGSARFQSVVDDYLAGKNVPRARLQKVWRDTTQVGSWDAPMYEAFFAAARAANAKLPADGRLRVLLGDPPINWSRIRTQSDWQAVAAKRETFMADLIERKVLAKGSKALVIAGLAHVTRGGGGVTDLIESRRPGSVFVAAIHTGFPKEAWESQLLPWPVPALAELAGTWIGLLPKGDGRAQDSLDGLIYLGAPETLHLSVPLPSIYRDDAYWRELKSRFELINDQPFSARAIFAAYSSPQYPSGFDPADTRRQSRFSACMRAEGVEAFPEPEFQFDSIGFFGDVMTEAQKDPQFESAQRTCARQVLGLAPPGAAEEAER
jgi:hypothetical protein